MEISPWPHLKLLLSSMLIAVALAADPYSDALLSFKSEIIDHFHSLDDWLVRHGENRSGKVHACSWSGVKCDKNSTIVIGLDLSTKKLGGKLPGKQFGVFTELVELNISQNAFSGEIPIEVFNLAGLRSLDISRNNFSGHFPRGISGLRNLVVLDAFSNSFSGPLPVELSKLEFLKVVNLAGSYFDGPIPSAYGSFKRLEFLHLAGNSLYGNIPPELGNLQTVTHMEIGYNSYQGNIPWQLGNMSELRYLDIAGANLSGTIPRQLSNLTKLHSLFLFRNQLTGLIPWEFSRILPLTDLDLSDNLISGPIPQSFAELKNLRLLSLMYNEMNGTVPDGIAELPSLDTLFIWNNFFTGSLPRNLGKNSKLRWLDVSTNNFIGSIPPHICAGGELYKLILFSNKFTGNLSPLSNCSSLVRIRLEDNSFGEIPLTLSHLPDVAYIDFSGNRFTGGIPSDISQASKLQYFNVSNNPELGGMVPEETWSLPLLQNFSASSCNISGNLPPFRSCKSMLVVELQRNNMSGVVPRSISNCKTLEIINLASNQLTGHIPEELASLPALSVVDLSHNNFSGSIPGEFGKSTNLLLLNVSFNDISGSIPSEKVLQSMGRSAYVGNPELCGAPLRSCSASMAIFGSKGTGKLRLILLLSAGVVMLISALVFWLVYFRNGSKGQWKMESFIGLPQFKVNDVLRSFDLNESMEELPPLSAAVCKAVLPTGITVLVKKLEWEPKRMKVVSEFVTQMGNARHRNLIRLLGFCYNKHMAYMLYDYLPNGNLAEKIRIPRDWSTKCRIIIGIAKGLSFLHHDCNPAISHGDMKSSNIVFDDNFEPRLADFGFKYLIELTKGGQCNEAIKDELNMDIYKFGEIILEILTNGRLINGGGNLQSKPKDVLLREICNENEANDSTNSLQDEIKLVVDVALLCTRSRPADRPSMEDAMKLLSGLKGQGK